MHCLPSGMVLEVNGVDLEVLDPFWFGLIQFEHELLPGDAYVQLYYLYVLVPSLCGSQMDFR